MGLSFMERRAMADMRCVPAFQICDLCRMRRSPPGLSCLMGLDLRKRPFADLTPEDPRGEAEESPPQPLAAAGDMAPVVEETPSFEHATGTLDNPSVECKG